MSDVTPNSSKGCSCCAPSGLVSQSMKEMDFERGIWQAAVDGDERRVKKFLAKGVCANAKDSSGFTALHYASRHGHLAMCQVLVSHSAEVNSQTPGGATPLHKAVCSGAAEVVRFLLQHGADPLTPDSDGTTAVEKAAKMAKKDVIAVISSFDPSLHDIDDKTGRTPFGTTQ